MSDRFTKIVVDLKDFVDENKNNPMRVVSHILDVYHSLDSRDLPKNEIAPMRGFLNGALGVIQFNEKLDDQPKQQIATWVNDKTAWEKHIKQ